MVKEMRGKRAAGDRRGCQSAGSRQRARM